LVEGPSDDERARKEGDSRPVADRGDRAEEGFGRWSPSRLATTQGFLPLAFIATIFFSISFLIHFPGMGGNVYSDLMDTLWQRILHADGIIPYLDYKLEYPAISAIVLYVSSLANNMYAFYVSMAAILFASMMGTLYLVYRLLRQRGMPVQAAAYFIVFTPAFIYYSIYSFDWIACVFMVGSIYFAFNGRIMESGVFMGLAVAARVIPIVILPFLVLGVKKHKQRALLLACTGASWLAVNAYFMVTNFQGFLYPYQFQAGYSVEDSWLAVLSPYSKEVSVLLFGAAMALILAKRRRFDIFQQSQLAVLAFMLTSFKFPPQYLVLLLPLFALTGTNYVEFLVANVLNVAFTLMYFTPLFAQGDPLLVTSPVQWVAYVRQLVLLVAFARLMMAPRTTVVNEDDSEVLVDRQVPVTAPFVTLERGPDSNGLKPVQRVSKG
jgi:hypothetical protein